VPKLVIVLDIDDVDDTKVDPHDVALEVVDTDVTIYDAVKVAFVGAEWADDVILGTLGLAP